MEVILLQDIPKVGKRFDVKLVAGGYARNFLIPRGLAELATERRRIEIEKLQKEHRAQKMEEGRRVENDIHLLAGKMFTTQERMNDKGGLFAGIDARRILELLRNEGFTGVTEENILLDEPVKEAGEHRIALVANGKTAYFILRVAAGD